MNTQKFTIGEVFILSALYVSSSDGDVDDSELRLILEDNFFKKYYTSEIGDLFFKILKDNTLNFLDIIRNDFKISFRDCSKDILENFLVSILRLIIVDGRVDKNEVFLLNTIGSSAGFSDDEVSKIIDEFSK
jgi:hypothetical protein